MNMWFKDSAPYLNDQWNHKMLQKPLNGPKMDENELGTLLLDCRAFKDFTLKMNWVLGQCRGSQFRNMISFSVRFRKESWNSPCKISPYSRCSSINNASWRFDKIFAWGLSSFTGVESPSKNIRRTLIPGLMSKEIFKISWNILRVQSLAYLWLLYP